MSTCITNMRSCAGVWVRTRPTACFAHEMIYLQPDGRTVDIHSFRDPKKGAVNNQIVDWSFTLDGILHNVSQEDVYMTVAQDVVTSALDGYNGTIMCYGQTGAGKTFTMTGATENFQHRGIIPRALSHLFREIEDRNEYCINLRVSYMEIYNEAMFDLLTTLPDSVKDVQFNPLTVVEDGNGVYVKGLQSRRVQSEEEALNLLFEGETNRAIAAHTLNQTSSRSHCIFTVYIESHSKVESDAKYTNSKLNFVDLAGSERLGKTQSEGKTKEEAMYINKSLSFLEQVVLALADRCRSHVPFRQSKLTHYLKDSIGGNCNTRLVANIWGEAPQIEETISTLRFATRMKNVSIEPCVNVHYDPLVMAQNLEKELALLKRELAMHDILANRSQIVYDPLTEQQRYEIRQIVRQYLEGKIDEIDIVNLRQIQGVFEAFREISNQMSYEIESRLRTRYTLIDRSDPTAIAAAQQLGILINDQGELVGEADGTGFGIGPASNSKLALSGSVIGIKKKEAKKSRSKEKLANAQTTKQPLVVPSKMSGGTAPSPPGDQNSDKRDDNSATPTGAAGKDQMPLRPSTPPPRAEQFEEFKRGPGCEIYRILSNNKDVLAVKKREYTTFAKQVNFTKSEIDRSLEKLTRLKMERETEGVTVNEDGDIVISETEYLEIKRLKDLKAVYRENFDELKNIKLQVQYCQNLVEKCRQRLVQEFDNWYTENYLAFLPEDALNSMATGMGMKFGLQPDPVISGNCVDEEQDKLDRLHMGALMKEPEAGPYYNAKHQTHRRKIYEAAESQFEPGHRKKMPGTPVRTIRNQPPTMLQVQ